MGNGIPDRVRPTLTAMLTTVRELEEKILHTEQPLVPTAKYLALSRVVASEGSLHAKRYPPHPL